MRCGIAEVVRDAMRIYLHATVMAFDKPLSCLPVCLERVIQTLFEIDTNAFQLSFKCDDILARLECVERRQEKENRKK